MVSNVNPKYNIPMQALNGQSLPNGIPMQAQIDAEAVKHTVDNSYLANRAKASEGTNPLAVGGTTAAVWYGISQGMDKFGPKCGGEYSTSVLGRLGNWGDKVAEKFAGNSVGKAVNGIWTKLKGLGNKATQKSDLAYAFANTPTRPEMAFAKTPGQGLHGFLAMDANSIFEQFLKPITENAQKLEQYGVNQKYIDDFTSTIKNLKPAEKLAALQKEELKLLGVKPVTIQKLETAGGLKGLQKLANSLKVRKLGFNSIKEYTEITKDTVTNVDKVIAALDKSAKADANFKVSIWRNNGFLGKIKNHLFGRTVSMSEYRNKYIATLGKGHKSALGKLLPKALGWFMEGTTNRFAGGKFMVLMQAAIFADMLINTYKAPKGEKGKTFVERFVNDFTYFLAMPLGIIGMHKVGGLKYAGLDKKGVDSYREALKSFNEKANAGLFKTKAEYQVAHKELKTLLKADVKNPITKLFKKIGQFINIGNETRAGFKSHAAWNMNFLRGAKNFFKNLAGVPMRIAIPMFLIIPLVAKLATKSAHGIFGRPTKSVLDEEKEPEVVQPQAQQPTAVSQPSVVNNSPTNLLNMRKNGQVYNNQTTNTTNNNVVNNNVIESKKNEDKQLEPVRTYIPNPGGVQVQGEDMTSGELALKRADAAERVANETLGMKW